MIFEEKAGTDAAGMQEAGSLDETQVSSAMPQAAATVIDNAPGNVVVLPDGAGITRITARGVDLVIVLDDGSQIVVPGGALNVPQIVVNDVAIPAINVAALLDGNEPQPAAGPPQSSGGNFASDPGALQAAYGLGDLLPYTEMEWAAPPTEEVIPQPIDRDVTVIVITPDQPAGAIQATSVVTESALPARPGEPAGSNPSSNGETTTGVVVFEVPDGVDTISINGTVVTGVGQTIVTPFGVLTITDIAPEQFTYSYVLTDNTTTNTPVDVFTIVVTDTDGDTAQGSLTISITDDVPLANDDAATQSGPNQPVAVTVLANDILGADGVQPSGVSYVPNSLSGTGQVVNNGNGTLVYVPGPGESGTVTFNYRIVDGDGDASVAKVTITLLADTHVAATSAAAATSDVAGDADPGSNVNAFTPQVSSGTLAIAYGSDGFGSFSASYDGALGAAVKTSAAGVTTFTSASWTLTINETTGAYTFTQTAPYAHDIGASSDSGIVTVSVADSDDAAPTTVTLTLSIADDVPLAVNDGQSATEGGAAVSGNVIANDDVGADVAGTVSAVRTGTEGGAGTALVVGTPYVSTFGTLTLNADGSYSYTPKTTVPAGSVDVFTYTLIDADGDPDTAELRFTFAGDNSKATATSAAAATSDVAGDADPGSNVNAFTPQVSSGTLAIAYGSDGFGSFGASYDGALGAAVKTSAAGVTTFTSASWTLTINETTGAYTFTQTAPYAHDIGASSDSGIVTVSVADSDDAAPTTVTLTLSIADDVPLAVNDGQSATEGGAAVSGNVIANDDVGADVAGTVSAVRTGTEGGAGTALVVGTPYVSTFGTLTLNADGSYSYTPKTTVPAGSVDVFTYTLIDADGDPDTAELRFTFAGDNSKATATSAAAATSDVAGDTDPGSNVNAFTPQVSSGTLAIAYGSDGFGSFSASYDGTLGAAVKTSAAGVTTFTSASWTLTINETTGAYTFTQTAPYAHDLGASSDSGIVTVSVADSDDAAPTTVTLTLSIADDVPLAVNDGQSATEGGAAVSGNVIANDDVGADVAGTVSAVRTGTEGGAGTALVVGTPYVSTFGTLTLNADGSYSYTPKTTVPAGSVDVFTYTLIDADGDPDTAELRFTFAGDNSKATATSAAAATSDVAGDADPGSNVNAFTPQVSSGTLAIAYGSDGFGSFSASYDGALGAAVKTSAAGVTTFTSASWTLTINETTGAYTFTQTAPYAHDIGASSDSGIVTVSVADSDDAAPTTVTLTLSIADDVPLAVNDGQSATEGGAAVSGNVIANDDVGADVAGTVSAVRTGTEGGAGTALVVGTPYVSTFGTLTLNADGSYSYTPKTTVPAGSVDVFTYTLIDADGDPDTAELRFTFAGDNSKATATSAAAATSDVAGDTDPGSNVNAFTPQVSSGTLAIAYGSDGFGSFSASYDGTLGAAVKTSAAGVTTFTSASWTLTINETTGAYTFTQTAPYAHDLGASSDSGIVTVSVADSDDAAPTTVTLTLSIADDVPLAVNDGQSATEGGAAVSGNVIANDDVGADVAGTVSAVRTGTEGGAGTALVVGTPYVSTFGTLTLNADGSYSYTPKTTVPAGSVDVFTYTLIDADGDPDTAELRFTFAGDNSKATATSAAAATSDVAGDADPGSNVNAFTPQVSSGTLAIAYGSDGFGSFSASYDGALGAAVKTSAAGVTTFTSASWTLTINETTGAYTFTQTAPYAHDIGASSDSGIVTVSVADSDDAAPTTVTLTLSIADDVPLAVNDGQSATEGGAAVSGNVIANDDVGADVAGTVSAVRTGTEGGAGTALVVGTPYVSTFGTLTLNADGSYSYTPKTTVPAGSVDVFTYTLIDADGDPDTAELRFTFAGDNSKATATSAAAATSDVAGDTDPGSNVNAFTPQVSSGTLAIAYGSDGFGSFSASYDGTLGAAVKTSAAGVTTFTSASWTLTINETTGAYTFTQTAPYAHDLGASSDSGIVTVSVADSDDAAPTTVTLTLSIADDVPLAVNDGQSATEGGAAVSGNVIANDDVGADVAGTVSAVRTGTEGGAGTALVVGTPYVSTFGTLTLNADGSYSYTPKTTVPAGSVDVFTYTLIDADGDPDTAELRFTFAGDNSKATATSAAAATSDVAGDADPGSNVNAFTPQVSSGTLAIAYGSDGFGSFNASYDGALGAAVKTSAAGVTTFTSASWTLTINETTGAYTFTQTAPYAHDIGASSDSGIVTVSVADSDDAAPTTVTLTLSIADDVPLAVNDVASVDEDAASIAGNVVSNDDIGADIPGTVTAIRTGTEAAGAGTAGTVGAGLGGTYGTLTVNANGSYTYAANNALPVIQALGVGESVTDYFTYTVKDADGDLDFAQISITIKGVNDAPTVQNSAVWMPSDPAQQNLTFPNGYPMNAIVPTDIDGDNLLVTATNTVAGVFYYNAGLASYVAVTAGTVLYNSATGVNFIDDLVYRPTAAIADTQNLQLNMSVFDGTATLTQTVFIHEVPQARLPGQSVQIGNGASPLTSGNDQVQSFVLSADFAAGLQGNLNIAQIVVKTDFQQQPNDVPIPAGERDPGVFGDASAGSHREQEVQAEVRIGANRFVIVEDDLTPGTFEQTWFYDPASGLMQATVSFSNVYLLDAAGNATATTLAQYLTANPPAAGNTWTVTYFDNDGGNWQARLVQFRFEFDDAGNPAITVNGDGLPDTIYGGTGNDILNGGGGNDTITGGAGNDTINGGAGTDTVTDPQPGDIISGVPPIVVDLDGDGAEFLPLSAGVRFDYAGNGTIEGTAWVGSDDGILAIDRNANGQVDGADEFVFSVDGSTDLEGLAVRYDSNGDGVLDANDAEFASFGVWQDANSDGVSDAGEFRTLGELGIASVSLRGDGVSYVTADGNVRVAGSTIFTRTDGSTGVVADATFAAIDVRNPQRSAQVMSAATLAAAGAMLANGEQALAAPDTSSRPAEAPDDQATVSAQVSDATTDSDAGRPEAGADMFQRYDPVVDGVKAPATGGHDASDTGFAQDQAEQPYHASEAPLEASAAQEAPAVANGSAFAFGDVPQMAAMQHLLSLQGAPQAANEDTASAGPVQNAGDAQAAIAEALASNAVDALIDKFAGTTADHAFDNPTAIALDGDVAGNHAAWMPEPGFQPIDIAMDQVEAHAA